MESTDDEDFFSGVGPSSEPPAKTKALKDLDPFEQRVQFQGWLASEWLQQRDAPEFFSLKEREAVWSEFEDAFPSWPGVHRGSTLRELVLTGQLVFDTPLAVVLNSRMRANTTGIRQLERLSALEILRLFMRSALRLRYGAGHPEPRVVALVKSGPVRHAVSLSHVDPEFERVVYYDTWPRASAFCAENNSVGLDAQPFAGYSRWWTLKLSEIIRVLHSLVVPQQEREVWASMDREGYDYATWQSRHAIPRSKFAEDSADVGRDSVTTVDPRGGHPPDSQCAPALGSFRMIRPRPGNKRPLPVDVFAGEIKVRCFDRDRFGAKHAAVVGDRWSVVRDGDVEEARLAPPRQHDHQVGLGRHGIELSGCWRVDRRTSSTPHTCRRRSLTTSRMPWLAGLSRSRRRACPDCSLPRRRTPRHTCEPRHH